MTPLQQSSLALRLERSDNPDWYLTLYGMALEETTDYDRAMILADEAYRDQPDPPVTDDEREQQTVNDVLALDNYLASTSIEDVIDADPPVNVSGQGGQQ